MYLFTLRQVPGLAFRHISITYVEMMFKIRFIFPVFVLSIPLVQLRATQLIGKPQERAEHHRKTRFGGSSGIFT